MSRTKLPKGRGAPPKSERPTKPLKKVRLREGKTIPIPQSEFGHTLNGGDEDDILPGVEEQDEIGDSAGFLESADPSALSRSKKETNRLHELSKSRDPLPRRSRNKEKMPSIASVSTGSFDSDPDFDSDLESEVFSRDGTAEASTSASVLDSDISDDAESVASGPKERRKRRKETNEEADFEVNGRQRWTGRGVSVSEGDEVDVQHLPIKLPTGEVQQVEGKTRIARPQEKRKRPPTPDTEDETESEEAAEEDHDELVGKMAGQKGKFGRMGVAEIVERKGWTNAQKLGAAKEQIARMGAEVMSGGELVDMIPVLTRMSTFALATVPSLEGEQGDLAVPAGIRGLAFLSLLAVFKDTIPGYRIRQLTALEEAEKVRDEVKRQREGERSLVSAYKGYLKGLEGEVKARSNLGSVCLRCLCDLLGSVPHFNFSENIMGVLVGRVCRRSWDEDADLVLDTFIRVFRDDLTGTHAQRLVRLIARMIKERKFQVHPNILSCLSHLRLRQELDSMRDGKRGKDVGKDKPLKMKGRLKSEIREKWRTKNQRKREKDAKIAGKEMAEAAAEVDQEERAQVQTETLKNLFVLYFSILKHPGRTPLLPVTLEGISLFAHFINIDFFRDLLAVLRRIITADPETTASSTPDADTNGASHEISASVDVRVRLLAIITAFDLLTGQGEALNIDLGDFVNALFGLLRPLSFDTSIEDPPIVTSVAAAPTVNGHVKAKLPSLSIHGQTTSELMFRCLNTIFFSRSIAVSANSSTRTAAFAKRLTEGALHFPPATATKALEFVLQLMGRDIKLEGMLDTEERMFDGVYRPEVDDPQLTNPFATSFWEFELLARNHWNEGVRAVAMKLRDGNLT